MRKFMWLFGAVGVLSLASVASATTYVWSFGSNPKTVADNTNYSGTNSGGTITVFSEQVTNGPGGGTFFSTNDSTINGLFSTNDSVFDEGIGIAPYDPAENGVGSAFSTQDGITDSANGSSTKGNILVLELGADIKAGTTLQFLIQAGSGASTDVVSDYWQDGGTQNLTSGSSLHLNGTTTAGEISTNGTTPQSQLTLTKNVGGIEFVAIEADCHYILLDTVTGTSAATPEPRFYGLLLAGLLGLAGTLYQRRRAAQVNA
jgi:hypothetical protein